MTPPDPTPPRDTAPLARPALVRQPLLALGAAAVLTVYTAGYARTREAAARFADADRAARRPGPPVGSPAPSVVPPQAVVRDSAAATVDTARAPANVAAAAPRDVPVLDAPKPPQPVVLAPQDSTARQDTAAPAATPAADTTSTASDSSARDSVATQPAWKDGEYYGWGTSRHGDIQAGVEIKGGRITAAWVQQCLTRYSCSWIAALPGQVVTRQSPEVDYVSGATQSTNAFYYAVVEALARAK